jgi:GalNAc-alpha-(1->4)-GalNAc-alpha-(1->3)-diNAcBac-PP-undecaprenol alpha-1,4-N-acetyl-D-galactosaminyltransferase
VPHHSEHSEHTVFVSAPELNHSGAHSIVLVTGGMDCGGAQRVLADMANYWVERGWQVTLATWSGPDLSDFYALSPKISREWLHVNPRRRSVIGALHVFVDRIAILRALLRQAKPDVVLSFIDVSNILTIIAALGLGVRVVVAERTQPALNDTVSRPWKVLRRLCYSWSDQVVAQTQDAAAWLERRCKSPVLVIPNFLRALPQIALPREFLIIAVGRLTAEKGFDVLLGAFARVRAQFPHWHLCIIGEGPERRALTEHIAKLDLADRVELLGEIRDVDTWMARAALLVHASRREGFPNAVLEGMGMGVAVICADCRSGPAELITDGVNGRLVPVDNLEVLTRVMSELMSDAKLRERLGAQATKVRRDYAQSVLMKKWEACLVPPPAKKTDKSIARANPASRLGPQ